jgi:hypothetical protein
LQSDSATTQNDFALIHRNKALLLELSKNKRSLNEARKELDMMRKKTREMESLVSIIQRGWSQLDIDTSLLLDGLADPEVEIPGSTSDLLKSFIHCSDKYLFQDPTNLSSFPSLQAKIDQWSSNKDIENTKSNLISSLPILSEENDASSSLFSSGSASLRCFTEEVEEHLSNHISFTFSILERLCYALNDGGSLISSSETLKSLQVLKESRSKETLLNDSILKLQSELLEMECKYCISENTRNKVERSLDKSYSTIRELEKKLSLSSSTLNDSNEGGNLIVKMENTSSSSDQQPNGNINSNGHSHEGNFFLGKNQENQEMSEQLAILEKQLMESETAKAEAEMQLTERIARPFTIQQDQQVSDLRKVMEEVRSQSKLRINGLLLENDALQERIKDLSFALNEVEVNATKKIEVFMNSFEKELLSLREEKLALESKVRSFQPLNSLEELNKILFKEAETVEDSKLLRITSLEKELKTLKETLTLIQKNMEKARKRERYLESVILHFAIPLPSNAKPRQSSSSNSGSSNSNSNHSSGSTSTSLLSSSQSVDGNENGGETTPNSGGGTLKIETISQQMIKQVHERCNDLEKELTQVKGNVNDFINEIDSISSNESAARNQSELLIKQVAESQSMQQAALEENLKLMNEIEELKTRKTESDSK